MFVVFFYINLHIHTHATAFLFLRLVKVKFHIKYLGTYIYYKDPILKTLFAKLTLPPKCTVTEILNNIASRTTQEQHNQLLQSYANANCRHRYPASYLCPERIVALHRTTPRLQFANSTRTFEPLRNYSSTTLSCSHRRL